LVSICAVAQARHTHFDAEKPQVNMGITNVNYDEVVAEENKPSHVNMDDRNRLRKDEDKEAFNEF